MKITLSSDHKYTDETGKKYPGVTTVIHTVYPGYPYPEGSAERGHHVHLATQLFDEDDLDDSTLDPVVAGYLEGWKRFRDEICFQVKQIELLVHNAVYGYCGTIDRIGIFTDRDKKPWVLDVKSGAKEWWHPLQTIAYSVCMEEPHNRGCLYLTKEGKYKFEAHTRRQDLQDWLCTLRVYQIMAENNIKKEGYNGNY